MKKVLIIFMAVFPFLCCAGRSHGAAEPPFVADTSGAGEAAATDRIRIRFADTVPLPREARLRQERPIRVSGGSTGLWTLWVRSRCAGFFRMAAVLREAPPVRSAPVVRGAYRRQDACRGGRAGVRGAAGSCVCRIRVPGRTCGLAAGGMCSDRGIRTIGGQTGVKYIYEWDKYTK